MFAGASASILLPHVVKGAPVEPGGAQGNPQFLPQFWQGQSGQLLIAPAPAAAEPVVAPTTAATTTDTLAASATADRFAALLAQARTALGIHGGKLATQDVIGIVDFAAPSRDPRFHLVNPANGAVLATHLVAHGRGSDPANSGWVEQLSNRYGSEASCGGSFVTGDTYYGRHGRSRRLIGLDAENSLASQRGIVIHAASYVEPGLAAIQGRVGRSQGCFAVSQGVINSVLEQLGPGRLLFAAR
ncbi:murein L,D-transpeptidase catalytic domain-containing protein [Novosphingobium sp.]|uniref:murein L,D-transpeptidase catalytic domain-containing protein n=1 Tax=Novosphingobium sp. TaxID=1874826 RepID=UPI0038B710F8